MAGAPLDPDWFPVEPDDGDPDAATTFIVTVTQGETITYRYPPPALHDPSLPDPPRLYPEEET